MCTGSRVPEATPLALAPRGVLAVACCIGLSAGLAGCGGDGDATRSQPTRTFPAGSTMDKIQKRGTLIVGVKYDQPSFGLLNPLTGQPEGFDIVLSAEETEFGTRAPTARWRRPRAVCAPASKARTRSARAE
jgi:hypothetical protein